MLIELAISAIEVAVFALIISAGTSEVK